MQRGTLRGDALPSHSRLAPACGRGLHAMLALLLSAALLACGGGGSAGEGEGEARATSGSNAPQATNASAAGATVATTSTLRSTADATTLTFSFELATPRTTSAGVYASDGTLLQTLWRGERLPAGRHVRSWGPLTDSGNPALAGPFTVRVVHHNVQYHWDGVVGNSSAAAGRVPHRSFLPPAGLAADGGQLHIGLGYNEAQSALHGLRVEDPQRPAPALTHADPFIGFGLVASDGQTLYAANTGGIHKGGFVVAFALGGRKQQPFDLGVPLCLATMNDGSCYAANSYRGVIAVRAPGEALPTGLAVQRTGDLLAVAHGGDNRVQVFNKRSGRLLAQWSAPLAAHSANQLAMTPAGDLWVLQGQTAVRYTAIDTQPRVVQTLTGLQQPLALATDPADDAVVWVAEGGSRQQVRRYDSQGVNTAVLGQAEGLQRQSTAAADRLCFLTEGGREHTALAVDGASRIWVVDTCNNRLQRFAAGGLVVDSVAWLPASYVAAVDLNRPQRVFANFLEFEVDYSHSIDASGGWRLLRNWLPSLPAALRDGDAANTRFGGFRAVTTLANGRTLAQLSVAGRNVIVELGATGVVRELRRLPVEAAGESPRTLQPNGDLHHAADEGSLQVVYRQRLEGFDADGSPRWAALPARLASVPRGSSTSHHRMGTWAGAGAPRWPVTESGLLVYFNGSVEAVDAWHLGAARVGSSAWAWQASPSGALDGLGSFQTRTQDPNIHYGGNVAMSVGRSVLYGYHGEFYTDLGNGRVGQANQFMHFLDNGLFVGQFGVASTRGSGTPEPGLSGNAFSPWLVKSAGRTYLYHNDESSWGGVHRWELQGLDGLVELSASGERGATLALQ